MTLKPISGSLPARVHGFTMIELLTVVSIVALITAFTVPALKGLGGAAGLNGAGTQFENIAIAARQNSISKGVLTAVAVLTGTSTAQPNPAYRTFMVLQCAPPASGALSASSTNWQMISKWETLSPGFVVDIGVDSNRNPESSFLQSPLIPNGSVVPPQLPILTYQNVQYQPVASDAYPPASGNFYAYQIFTPEGRFYSNNDGYPIIPCSLRIVGGFYAGSVRTYTSGGTNYYKFIFNDATGQIKIIRP